MPGGGRLNSNATSGPYTVATSNTISGSTWCPSCCVCTTTAAGPCACGCRCGRARREREEAKIKQALTPRPQKTWPAPKRRR